MIHVIAAIIPILIILTWIIFFKPDRHKNKAKRYLTLIISGAFVSFIILWCFLFKNPYLLALPSIAHSIALCIIWRVGYKTPLLIRESSKSHVQSVGNKLQEEEEEDNQVEISILNNKYDELYIKMEYLLKNKQIFRNPDLRLNDLALKLGTNRTYVSQLINNKTNSSFNDYINSYRVEFVKNLLSSTKGELMTLDEIALKSGFSSQSSFYRVFMKMEETSPAKYRMTQIENSNQLN